MHNGVIALTDPLGSEKAIMPGQRRDDTPPRMRHSYRRALMLAVLAGGLVLVCAWSYHTFVGTNLHTVVPGQIYRSAQLEPRELAEVVERLGIRTVINLRGYSPGFDWYEREKETLQRLGVKHWDVRLSYRSPPAVPELQRLVKALTSSERPILMHCRRGADRTGLASSIAVLLEGGRVEQARGQLSIYYGWFPLGGPKRLPQVLDWYVSWLHEQGLSHNPEQFQRWAEEIYRPGHLWAEIVPMHIPKRWSVGQSVPATFRVINRSPLAWQLRTSPRVGVHLRAWLLPDDWEITDPAQLANLPTDAAGFFEDTIRPGEAREIRLGLPRTSAAGHYLLLVDLVDAKDGPFCIYGSPAFRRWVRVEQPQ